MAGRKAQTWSIDVVIAVVIFGFIAAIITSFALLEKPDTESLQRNAQEVTFYLEEPIVIGPDLNCSEIFDDNKVNIEGIECLFNSTESDYEEFKKQTGIKGDFCIYLEDEDGNIVYIQNKTGWGSPELIVADKPCGVE